MTEHSAPGPAKGVYPRYQAPDADLPSFICPTFPAATTMFFCIGAQKAGTTWLYDYLSQSEQVHFCRNKELHYFDVRAGRGNLSLEIRLKRLQRLVDKCTMRKVHHLPRLFEQIRETLDLLDIHVHGGYGPDRHDRYLRYLLQGHAGQPVVADITPGYSVLDRAHFADMAAVGNARFAFILRDPVARMWSQIRMSVATSLGKKSTPEALMEGCRAHAEKLISEQALGDVRRANYLHTMSELEAAVPADRICYVFYEDLFAGDAAARICQFLQIDAPPVDTEKRVNEGVRLPIPDDLRAAFRAAFDPQYKGIAQRFGSDLPKAWAL